MQPVTTPTPPTPADLARWRGNLQGEVALFGIGSAITYGIGAPVGTVIG